MPTLSLLCAELENREKLSLLAGESGFVAHAAGGLRGALEIVRERKPSVFLIVDSPLQNAEPLLREILRDQPLLPVVVCMMERDANRAVAFLKIGASEVLGPPWTRESLKACLSKAARSQGTAVSVLRPIPRRKAPVYFAAVALFLGIALGVLSRRNERRAKEEFAHRKVSWDLPYRHPSAMAFDGPDLWIADWFNQSLYLHSQEGPAIRRVVYFPAETPVSVSFTADAAWTVSASGEVTRRMKNAALTPVHSYRLGNSITAIAYDGLYLWTYDRGAKVLQKRLMDPDLSVVASYRYPGLRLAGLVFDGKTLWSLDGSDHELLRHNLERPDEVLDRVALPEYGDGRFRPAGLGWNGKKFWTVGERIPPGSGAARLFLHEASNAP